MYIHTNLKYLRNKNLFKQEFVAQKLGIPKTTYGTYERGTYEPNIATLIKLSDLYGVSIDALLRQDMIVEVVNEPPAKYNTAQQDTELKSALQRVKDLEQTIAAKDELIAVLKIYNK